MNKVLNQDFFNRNTVKVAKDLLGKKLTKKINGKTKRFTITETEAYVGKEDKACHASKGKTPRTKIMFGPPGYFYIYLVYGMHWMLNIVTEEKGHPSAVLIRGVEDYDGPGKITKNLGIDKTFNGMSTVPKTGLWFEHGKEILSENILSTPRIGVDYAGEWAKKPYRFILVKK